MVYLQATMRLAPDKGEEFSQFFIDDFRPWFESHGATFVAAWHGDGPDERVHLWSFPSREQLERSRQAWQADEEYQRKRQKLAPLRLHEVQLVLDAARYAPSRRSWLRPADD